MYTYMYLYKLHVHLHVYTKMCMYCTCTCESLCVCARVSPELCPHTAAGEEGGCGQSLSPSSGLLRFQNLSQTDLH